MEWFVLGHQVVMLAGEEGQDLSEYALVLALIAVVAYAALCRLGNNVSEILSTVASSI
jgi:Flp pilus assembly pilin Flp